VSPLLERLLALAFARAPLEDANQAIARAREDRGVPGQPAVSYEAALPALDPDHHLAHQLLPRLVYFLDCRGAALPAAGGVFVSLFTPGGLYFLEAGPLVVALAAVRGLSLGELRHRYGQAGVGDPPLLGT
jgi:hypothetical protein